VAGVISSQDAQCPGFRPRRRVYAFRVFANAQVSPYKCLFALCFCTPLIWEAFKGHVIAY